MSDLQPITKLNVSTNVDEEEIFGAQGYELLNSDLNEGVLPKNRVFLWYKRECGVKPVTRIQLSFNENMKKGLSDAGYELVNRDLNAGVPGDHIFLWSFCGSTQYDIPIVNLQVTKNENEEPALLRDGWERLGCDLNRNAGGCFIYLWVKRATPTYICDVAATIDNASDKQHFIDGYTRIDENVNRRAGGNFIFLWYRRSSDKSKALSALEVSNTFPEQVNLQEKGYKKIAINLNKGTQGDDVYLWYSNEGCEEKMQSMALLINSKTWMVYQKNGIFVLEKNLNEGNKGMKMYVAYK